MSLATLPESQPLPGSAPETAPPLPTLEELGGDLLTTTPRQRRWPLARPFLLVLCFAAAWQLGLWWLTHFVVFQLFIAVVTVTHDVVHGALGLAPRQSEWWLFFRYWSPRPTQPHFTG